MPDEGQSVKFAMGRARGSLRMTPNCNAAVLNPATLVYVSLRGAAMGLYPQPEKWTCGPFALKHALAMLGVFVDERHVGALAGTNWWAGTDELKLGRAARAYHCELRLERYDDHDVARKQLDGYLRRGVPVLLCVDEWSHWVTVVRAEGDKYVVLDSARSPVIEVHAWRRLQQRWAYRRMISYESKLEHLYDLHALVPRFRVRTTAKLTVARARYFRRRQNRELARRWEEYFDLLSPICRPRGPRRARRGRSLSMGEFLRRNGEMMLIEVARTGRVRHLGRAARALKNLRFFADAYDLALPTAEEKRAIATLTAYLLTRADRPAPPIPRPQA